MNRVRVKICGITSLKDLEIAVEAGTDAVGMVVGVPESPRNISIEKARELIKSTPIFIETVVVTVLTDLNKMVELYQGFNPNILQIHGIEQLHKEVRESLPNARLIGAIQVKPNFTTGSVGKIADSFDAILLDSYLPGKQGGSGITHDWKISRLVRKALHPKRLILTGGVLLPLTSKRQFARFSPMRWMSPAG